MVPIILHCNDGPLLYYIAMMVPIILHSNDGPYYITL